MAIACTQQCANAQLSESELRLICVGIAFKRLLSANCRLSIVMFVFHFFNNRRFTTIVYRNSYLH